MRAATPASASRTAAWEASIFVELLGRDVIADGVRQDEITVRQPLHQRARAQAVGAMVGEVRLADDVQAGNGGHQVVIHP